MSLISYLIKLLYVGFFVPVILCGRLLLALRPRRVHSHWHSSANAVLPGSFCPAGCACPPTFTDSSHGPREPPALMLLSWLRWAVPASALVLSFRVLRDANSGAQRELLFLQVNPAHALPPSSDGPMGRVICLFQIFCGFTMYLSANHSMSLLLTSAKCFGTKR